MRILLQRVTSASVTVEGRVTGEIGRGLLVFVGVGRGDSPAQADYLVEKIANIRIFEDEAGKMNRTVGEVGGGLLIVSQFTLYANIRRGRRPSFDAAAAPADAAALYDYFVGAARATGVTVQTGVFQAHMDVRLLNDGPVTIFHDSAERFATTTSDAS